MVPPMPGAQHQPIRQAPEPFDRPALALGIFHKRIHLKPAVQPQKGVPANEQPAWLMIKRYRIHGMARRCQNLETIDGRVALPEKPHALSRKPFVKRGAIQPAAKHIPDLWRVTEGPHARQKHIPDVGERRQGQPLAARHTAPRRFRKSDKKGRPPLFQGEPSTDVIDVEVRTENAGRLGYGRQHRNQCVEIGGHAAINQKGLPSSPIFEDIRVAHHACEPVQPDACRKRPHFFNHRNSRLNLSSH